MDILDILLDILLKPPQPFIGLFFIFNIEVGEKCFYFLRKKSAGKSRVLVVTELVVNGNHCAERERSTETKPGERKYMESHTCTRTYTHALTHAHTILKNQ